MRNIYFRADAGTDIGYGHFIRTLALADMLREDFDCTFFTCHPTPYQIGEMEKVCPHVTLQEGTHYEDFLSYLQGDETVVLDNYFFDTGYQRAVKQRGCCLVCIDDMHNKHYVADVVINHTLTDTSLFDVEPYTKLCLGFDWALLRKPFLKAAKRLHASTNGMEKVAICFGGSDEYDNTSLFINKILRISEVKFIAAIVGDAYQSDNKEYNSERVQYYSCLTADGMASLFCDVDWVICSASSVCLEAMACGSAIAVGWYTDNQMDFYKLLINQGLAIPLDNIEQFLQRPIGAIKTIPNKGIISDHIQQQYIDFFSELTLL